MSEEAPPIIPRLRDEITETYKEPLTPTVKLALLALVIFFHVGGGWALTQIEPVKLIVGDVAPMEVRMVSAEQPAQPDLPYEEPPPPPELKPPAARTQATAAGPCDGDRASAARPAAAGLPGRGAAAQAGEAEAEPRRPSRCRSGPRHRRTPRSRLSRGRQRRPLRRRQGRCHPRSWATWCRPTRSTLRARARPASRGPSWCGSWSTSPAGRARSRCRLRRAIRRSTNPR